MNPTRTYAIFLRQFYLVHDNLTRLFQMFIWIIVDILLWGFISKYLNGVAGATFSFVSVILGAILLWDFLIRVMQGMTMAFFEDVWSRNFMNIFASPLTTGEYIGGLVLASIATSIIGLATMLILAYFVFGFSILIYGTAVIAFLFILFLSGIALGIFGVALVLRLGPSAEWFVWPIPALLSPFVGVVYPLNVLPQWMQYVGLALPPSYVFEGVRAIVAHGSFNAGSFAIGLALSVFYIVLAYFVFKMVHRTAVRTGLLARYSAETNN